MPAATRTTEAVEAAADGRSGWIGAGAVAALHVVAVVSHMRRHRLR